MISTEYVQLLKDFSITEVHSSPRSPMGNGACERVNRTIIQMLKSAVSDLNLFDEEFPAVVITYNTTDHSQIQMSLSQSILSKSHSIRGNFPVDAETVDAWRPGHRIFYHFKLIRVIKKIHRVGHLLRDKLLPKFKVHFL